MFIGINKAIYDNGNNGITSRCVCVVFVLFMKTVKLEGGTQAWLIIAFAWEF